MNREIIKNNEEAFIHWVKNGQFSVLYRYRNDLTDKFNEWEVISTLNPMEAVLNLYNKDIQFVINDDYVHLRKAEKDGAKIRYLKSDTRDNLWNPCKGPANFGLRPVDHWEIYIEPIKPGTVYKFKGLTTICLITKADEATLDCIVLQNNKIETEYVTLKNNSISHIPDEDHNIDDLEIWTPTENELCVSTDDPLSRDMLESNDFMIEIYKKIDAEDPNKRVQPTFWYPIESLKLFNYYFENIYLFR